MKSFLFLFLFLFSLNVFGQPGSFNDLFHIGEVSSGANVVIEVGDSAEFRYNFSTSKMQVSHDGISYYDSVGRIETLTFQNKTLDDSNKIDSSKYGVRIEVGDDSIASGDRTTRIDMHSSNGVDYSFRTVRAAGINGNADILNAGAGTMRFFNNGVYSYGITNAGGVSIQGVGSLGGNVPHNCTARSLQESDGDVTAICAVGEIATGGGCDSSTGGANQLSRPESGLTRWRCVEQVQSGAIVAWAVCCKY